AVLEEVAEAGSASGDELARVALLDVLAEHQHPHIRILLPDERGGADALVREGRRHAHVDDGEVGGERGDRAQQPVGLGDGADDLMSGVREQSGDALPEQDVVLGDHDAHGTSATIVVGPPAGLVTVSVPLAAATRPARPASPVEAPLRSMCAPPAPSSTTTICRRPGSVPRTDTRALRACACLAMFVSDSATTK